MNMSIRLFASATLSVVIVAVHGPPEAQTCVLPPAGIVGSGPRTETQTTPLRATTANSPVRQRLRLASSGRDSIRRIWRLR